MAFGNIGLQEPSTITKRVASVTIDRGSTTEHQEVLVLGDVSSSNAIARVLGATPASTEFGLAVRVVEQPSTTVAVSSLAGKVQVVNSSAGDLNVTVAGYSTVVSVSTGSVRVHQSSAADLNVTVAGYSTTVNVSSVGGVVVVNFEAGLESTVAPSSNSSGLIVRPVIDAIQTVASSNAFASTSLTIQSSAADIRTYVTAYSVMSTAAGPHKVQFYDGSSMVWPMMFASVSSAISGAVLAVSAPAYLFRGSVANALTLQTPSSVAGYKVAVSYFRAP